MSRFPESNKHYKIQNDGEYWVIDKDKKPVEPLSVKYFDEFRISKNPKNIPSKKLDTPILTTAIQNKAKQDRKNRILEIANDQDKLNELIANGEEL